MVHSCSSSEARSREFSLATAYSVPVPPNVYVLVGKPHRSAKHGGNQPAKLVGVGLTNQLGRRAKARCLVGGLISLFPRFFSPDSHRLISRVALEGRWASQDAMTRPLMRFAYAITSLSTFFTISKPSFLLLDSHAMNSETKKPARKPIGPKIK
jgi:hypothetical protein